MGHLALVDMKAEMEEDALRDAPDGADIRLHRRRGPARRSGEWPSLAGPHNRANAQAAVARCAIWV
jgi:UDP-N-acetylmuramoylalanine--D-glutamate ligase